jgi:GNAT superfamily N-acetyltransferase
MEVRILQVNEIEKLYPIADAFFSASEFLKAFNRDHFKQQWSAFINSGYGVIFVVEKEKEVVGCLGGLKFSDPNTGKMIASELFWFVLPDYRGNGSLLLEAFELWAHQEGCSSIIMVYLTDSMPNKVRSIYESRGYKAMEIHYIKEV